MRSSVPPDYPGCPATVASAMASGSRLSPTKWGLSDAAITLGGAWLIGLVVGLALLAAKSAGAPIGIGSTLLVGATAPWLLMLGWPILATRRWGNGPTIDLGLRFERSDLLWGIGGGAVITVLASLASALTTSVVGEFDSAAGEAAAELAAQEPRWQVVVFALLIAVGAPLAEEVAFRGMLWAGIARAGADGWWTWAGTTIIFALFHLEPVRLGVLLVIGAGLGYLRLRTGRVGASILAHMINNIPGAIMVLML